MAEADGGELRRHGDLDSWTDVFRATAGGVRSAWRHGERLSYESLAFAWLALARKHEALQVAPASALAEDVTATASSAPGSASLAAWLGEAQWVQAAHQSADKERLAQLLGLQAADLIAFEPNASGWRPGFLFALHHGSRTVRVVVRGGRQLGDMLHTVAGHSGPLGAGFAHHGLLSGAQQLLQEEGERLRGALEGHPGYGLHFIGHSLGAGTAALLAVLVATDSGLSQQLGSPASVRATCFAPPPVLTAELAEQCAPYVDSVVYNADMVSRCSYMSLRRLAADMSAASEEVLARSELAQALRRSGALGLANHLVAAALCRCQPQQQESPAGQHLASGVVLLPRQPIAEGVVSGGPLAKSAAAFAAAPTQPNGRVAPLATLVPPVSRIPSATTLSIVAATAEAHKAATGAATNQPPSPPAATATSPGPVGPPNGTLPPLVAVGGAGGGGAAGGASRPVGDSPLRRQVEPQGVLSPPPLVAAAAAASASAQAAIPGPALGPTPSRRGAMPALADLKPVVQHDGLPAALPAAAGGGGGDEVSRPRPDGSTSGGGGVVLEPLQAPPTLPGAGLALAAPGVAPGYLPGQRREGGSLEGMAVTGATAAPPAQAAMFAPLLLPPLQLPPVGGSASQSRCQSPRAAATRQGSVRDLPLLPPGLPAVSPSSAAELVEQASPFAKSSQQQSQQPDVVEVATSPAPQYHELLVPGCLCVIERRGADATASFRLLRDFARTQLNRILLKRSMLRDHLLSHYVTALERVSQQQH